MWPHTFSDRLDSWLNLRRQCTTADLATAVTVINQWWFTTPWTPYHLHWDDQPSWPDPWQLLDDNLYCSLARGLGILYTIAIMDREDLQNATLAEVGSNNLVLLDKNKYILNWDRDTVVNINPGPITKSQHQITQTQIKLQIK